MNQTPNEKAYFERIRQHVALLHDFLNSNIAPSDNNPVLWFEFVAKMRAIQGNVSNDQSFLATILAKNYLIKRFQLENFDAAEKAQGAPGLDLDLYTVTGERIVGEIKTTVPYGTNDVGAQQKASFIKDFNKLVAVDAQYKFFFVTNDRTYEIVQRRYAHQIPNVEVVLLTDILSV